MTIKKIFILSLSLLFNTTLILAQSISGKILSENDEAIPYATIQIGKENGTVANEEGDFTISINQFSNNEIVKISCLGFETIEIDLEQFISKNYILKERFDSLLEVSLTNKKLTVREILQEVRNNLTTNYSSNNNSTIFYRSSTFNTPKKLEFEILKASESSKKNIKSLNTQFKALRGASENKSSSFYNDVLLNYFNFNDSVKIKVKKATKLINNNKDKSINKLQKNFINIISKQLDSGATYKLKSGLFKIEDSLKLDETFKEEKKESPKTNDLSSLIKSLTNKHVINEDSYFSFLFNETKNKYVLNGIVYFNDNPHYKINFIPKSKSEKFEGVFYVNANDFAVVKIEYSLGKNRLGKRLNLKVLVGIKYIENKIQGSVLFQKSNDGYYNPIFINNEKQQYVYFSRSLKFIKNLVNDDDDKSIFKLKFKIETIILNKKELFFVENKETSENLFKLFKKDENYKIDLIEKYNPETWKNYKIIAPVESIKNYAFEEE